MKDSILQLRCAGFLEGISLIVLLFIAVPLKYFFDMPLGVKVMGPLHGMLFLTYLMLSLSTALAEGWRLKVCIRVWVAAVIPFGTFLNDPFLVKKQA